MEVIKRDEVLRLLEEKVAKKVWRGKDPQDAIEYTKGFDKEDDFTKIAKGMTSQWAYFWGKDIGHRDLMIDQVQEDAWALRWARDIGDEEIMKPRIKESMWSYFWVKYIGEDEGMRKNITEELWKRKLREFDERD